MPKTDNELNIKDELTEPGRYAVVLLNDDFTPMEFVVVILSKLFGKTHAEAVAIMLSIHKLGRGVAGVYSLDIALTKKAQADAVCEEFGHPLRIEIEAEQ